MTKPDVAPPENEIVPPPNPELLRLRVENERLSAEVDYLRQALSETLAKIPPPGSGAVPPNLVRVAAIWPLARLLPFAILAFQLILCVLALLALLLLNTTLI